MGLQFHETMYGKNFFEHQLPRLTKAIEKLADQNNKQETVPSYPFQLANEEPRQRLLAVMDDPEKAEAFARTGCNMNEYEVRESKQNKGFE